MSSPLLTGVIGVVENLGDDAPSFVPPDLLLVDKDTHELGDGDSGVRICEGDWNQRRCAKEGQERSPFS